MIIPFNADPTIEPALRLLAAKIDKLEEEQAKLKKQADNLKGEIAGMKAAFELLAHTTIVEQPAPFSATSEPL